MPRRTSKAFEDACDYLHISEVDSNEGINMGNGVRKAEGGYIRTPKSKQKPEERIQVNERPVEKKISVQPENKPFLEYVEVIFTTDIGSMKGFYYPVVDAGDYIILGLSDNSFVPKSYKESPDLRFSVTVKDNTYNVVYTGCRWRDPETNREQIILMKVNV